jgi:hypothetical protein
VPSSSVARGAIAGVVPGVLAIAALLFLLQLAGLPGLAAYAIAAPVGVGVTVLLCRRDGGPEPDVGMAVVLTLAYSLLAGVLVAFALAVVEA